MKLDTIIEKIKEPMKSNGYKKKNLNWFKTNGTITLLFNIQKSQYGSDLWYYNFGIGLNELKDKPISYISMCQITERLDMKLNGKELSPDILLKAILSWENKYGDLKKLQNKAFEGKLPKTTTRHALTYLTTVKI